MTVARSGNKLDKLVNLRGSIAHRGQATTSVTKENVTDYFNFIKQLAAKTGGAVNSHVRGVTGRSLWITKPSGERVKKSAHH